MNGRAFAWSAAALALLIAACGPSRRGGGGDDDAGGEDDDDDASSDDDSWVSDDDGSDDDGSDDDASDDDGTPADDDASDDDGTPADDDGTPPDDDGTPPDDDVSDDDAASGDPRAVCLAVPTSLVEGDTITWDGADSYDTTGREIVDWDWSEQSFPAGSDALVSGSGAVTYTETDLAGTYDAILQVTNDLGETDTCTATATVEDAPDPPAEDLVIEIVWDVAGDDMDLHLLDDGGTVETSLDCYYVNCVGGLDWGVIGEETDDPVLEADDISGTGPERIVIPDPAPGTYTAAVNDYPGSIVNGTNTTTMRIYVRGVLVGTLTDPMDAGEDSWWYAAEITFPAGTVEAIE